MKRSHGLSMLVASLLVASLLGCTASDPDRATPERIAELESRLAAAEASRIPFAADRAACDRFIELAREEGMFAAPVADDFRDRVWLQCVVGATQTTRPFTEAKARIVHDCTSRAPDTAHLRACYEAVEYRSARDEADLQRLVDCSLAATNAEELDQCK